MIRSKEKRIGIFGGSFDPPHHGHLEISKLAIEKLSLDQIYWCITKKNPLKNKTFFSLPKRIKKKYEIISVATDKSLIKLRKVLLKNANK